MKTHRVGEYINIYIYIDGDVRIRFGLCSTAIAAGSTYLEKASSKVEREGGMYVS